MPFRARLSIQGGSSGTIQGKNSYFDIQGGSSGTVKFYTESQWKSFSFKFNHKNSTNGVVGRLYAPGDVLGGASAQLPSRIFRLPH